MHPGSWADRLLGGALVVAAAAGLAACGEQQSSDVPFAISVDPGIQARMAPAEVAAIVFDHIHADERLLGRVVSPVGIVRMTVTRSSRVGAVEPEAGKPGPGAPGANDVVWVVRALGTFTSQRAADGGKPLPEAGSGFYVITDADGTIAAFGFP